MLHEVLDHAILVELKDCCQNCQQVGRIYQGELYLDFLLDKFGQDLPQESNCGLTAQVFGALHEIEFNESLMELGLVHFEVLFSEHFFEVIAELDKLLVFLYRDSLED